MKQLIPMEYSIMKSDRKTISITIKEDGAVIVRAPRWVSDRRIQLLVKEKEKWILEKYQELQERNQDKPIRRYTSGERYPLYGQIYVLEVHPKELTCIRIYTEKDHVILEGPVLERNSVKQLLREWYIRQAREIFARRVAYYANKLGVSYGKIRVKEQKTRWGSCSEKGNLNFNWKLLLAPPQILDYVVVHEVCHLKHMNHSADFWSCVKGLLPEYESQRTWLREHAGELEW